MLTLRESSLDDFIEWYLRREKRKDRSAEVPDTSEGRLSLMREKHSGKLRDSFHSSAWSIVLLNRIDELENLIFLESQWTKKERLVIPDGTPNYRLLSRVAENALGSNYLGSTVDPRHRQYYEAMRSCHFRLECSSRLALCTASESERRSNPSGVYYLHDGAGRALAYLLLIKERKGQFEPVEAFIAEAVATAH